MVRNGLADLDELILLCRDEKAKSYIAEAISCYKAGAYRQCIVATWIAIVYDIIHKLQELDLAGDKKARIKLEEFEKILTERNIQKTLDFERQILNMARGDFDLLSAIEYVDLVRIRDDRNRCAHPSLNTLDEIYSPPAELARTHLRNAVTHLLQRPPVQGKAALDSVINELESDYFPGDVEGAKAVFKNGPLSRPRESLVRNFTIILIKSILSGELEEKKERKYVAALIALRELFRSIVEDTFHNRLNNLMQKADDNKLSNCISFLYKIADTAQFLEDNFNTRIQNYVKNMPDDNLSPGLILALGIPELNAVASERLNTVDSSQLSELLRIDYQNPRSELINRAVQLYTNSDSYDQANFIARNLIIPSVRYFNLTQIELIIQRAQENSQIRRSNERRSVFNAIEFSGIISEDNFNELLTRYGFDNEVFIVND